MLKAAGRRKWQISKFNGELKQRRMRECGDCQLVLNFQACALRKIKENVYLVDHKNQCMTYLFHLIFVDNYDQRDKL